MLTPNNRTGGRLSTLEALPLLIVFTLAAFSIVPIDKQAASLPPLLFCFKKFRRGSRCLSWSVYQMPNQAPIKGTVPTIWAHELRHTARAQYEKIGREKAEQRGMKPNQYGMVP